MGNKLVYDSENKKEEKEFLFYECNPLLFGLLKYISKRAIHNIFSNIDLDIPLNKIRIIELENIISTVEKFKIYITNEDYYKEISVMCGRKILYNSAFYKINCF